MLAATGLAELVLVPAQVWPAWLALKARVAVAVLAQAQTCHRCWVMSSVARAKVVAPVQQALAWTGRVAGLVAKLTGLVLVLVLVLVSPMGLPPASVLAVLLSGMRRACLGDAIALAATGLAELVLVPAQAWPAWLALKARVAVAVLAQAQTCHRCWAMSSVTGAEAVALVQRVLSWMAKAAGLVAELTVLVLVLVPPADATAAIVLAVLLRCMRRACLEHAIVLAATALAAQVAEMAPAWPAWLALTSCEALAALAQARICPQFLTTSSLAWIRSLKCSTLMTMASF